MKTTTAPTLLPPTEKHVPDFGGRPRRINLEQILAVKGHGKLKVRPIRLDDEQEMIRFHEHLSEESIYLRYFEYLGLDRRTSHERLCRICSNTPESYAVVIEQCATPHHSAAILAVGRLTKTSEPYVATFDTLMTEEEQGAKLGKILINRLITMANAFGFRTLTSELLVDDHDALNLCRALGFTAQTIPEDGLVKVTIDL
jgi:acetyltransferase